MWNCLIIKFEYLLFGNMHKSFTPKDSQMGIGNIFSYTRLKNLKVQWTWWRSIYQIASNLSSFTLKHLDNFIVFNIYLTLSMIVWFIISSMSLCRRVLGIIFSCLISFLGSKFQTPLRCTHLHYHTWDTSISFQSFSQPWHETVKKYWKS